LVCRFLGDTGRISSLGATSSDPSRTKVRRDRNEVSGFLPPAIAVRSRGIANRRVLPHHPEWDDVVAAIVPPDLPRRRQRHRLVRATLMGVRSPLLVPPFHSSFPIRRDPPICHPQQTRASPPTSPETTLSLSSNPPPPARGRKGTHARTTRRIHTSALHRISSTFDPRAPLPYDNSIFGATSMPILVLNSSTSVPNSSS
jgi:hypothetical protein